MFIRKVSHSQGRAPVDLNLPGTSQDDEYSTQEEQEMLSDNEQAGEAVALVAQDIQELAQIPLPENAHMDEVSHRPIFETPRQEVMPGVKGLYNSLHDTVQDHEFRGRIVDYMEQTVKPLQQQQSDEIQHLRCQLAISARRKSQLQSTVHRDADKVHGVDGERYFAMSRQLTALQAQNAAFAQQHLMDTIAMHQMNKTYDNALKKQMCVHYRVVQRRL